MVQFNNLSELLDLEGFDNDQLLTLRDQINIRVKNLSSINLEEELVNQLIKTKELLADAYDSETESSSQKASLVNACSAIIRDLAKTQSEIHNSERVKLLERILIETLGKYDTKIKREFMELYEKRLQEKEI